MSQKWNLQDIQPSRPKKRRRPASSHMEGEESAQNTTRNTSDDAQNSVPVRKGGKKKFSFALISIVALVLFVVAILIISYSMRGAEITVEPQAREVTINSVVTGTPLPQADTLAYEVLSLEKEGERQVNANGTEAVETQAEGTIIIYNEQSTEPIRLVTNTRFETGDGLIFRITDPAIVPGYTADDDGSVVPGTITADVIADDVGEEYNVSPSTFTIPGFAGEPEFETVYAESVESFTGGFAGDRFIISDDDFNTATQALRTELRNSLLEELDGEVPAGFVAFPNAVTFTYETLPSVAYGEDLATIKEIATLRIPLFDKADLAAYIAAASIPGYEDVPVRIEETDVLEFSYEDQSTEATDISTAEELQFKLVGKPYIVWEYDAENLKADLLNMNESALLQVLDAYPAIIKAEAVIRPFWRSTFPIDMEEVTVTEVLPE